MPLYEYICANCSSRFEALRPMSQSDAPLACPRCAQNQTRRVVSTVAVIGGTSGKSSSNGGGCGSCGGGHCASCRH